MQIVTSNEKRKEKREEKKIRSKYETETTGLLLLRCRRLRRIFRTDRRGEREQENFDSIES